MPPQSATIAATASRRRAVAVQHPRVQSRQHPGMVVSRVTQSTGMTARAAAPRAEGAGPAPHRAVAGS
eukprot:3068051-Alexandrium_andersonii.AAC.1